MSITNQEKYKMFGEALSYALDLKNLSQADLSVMWNKDEGQISKYINNKSTPYPKNIRELGNLLNVRFIKLPEGYWQVVEDSLAIQAIDSVNRAEDLITVYKAKRRDRDEIPALLELRDMIERDVDELLKKK